MLDSIITFLYDLIHRIAGPLAIAMLVGIYTCAWCHQRRIRRQAIPLLTFPLESLDSRSTIAIARGVPIFAAVLPALVRIHSFSSVEAVSRYSMTSLSGSLWRSPKGGPCPAATPSRTIPRM